MPSAVVCKRQFQIRGGGKEALAAATSATAFLVPGGWHSGTGLRKSLAGLGWTTERGLSCVALTLLPYLIALPFAPAQPIKKYLYEDCIYFITLFIKLCSKCQ